MKKLKSLLFSESGMAMPMVIIIVTAAVSSIAYIIVTLLPQLQQEKKKAQDTIHYKMFITSLNDYVVHGIREKWCVNKIAYSGGVLETDLLMSNDCGSTVSMEKTVTFPGNLERILWDGDTIGTDTDPAGLNTILGLNKKNRLNLTPPPPLLTRNQIEISELKLHLSETVLQDMTDLHPLYIITKDIRKCIESVDVVIKRDSAFVVGDDKQISVSIKGNIYPTKLSCKSTIRDLSSTVYYTFYPRRLHNFALIKYGDLKANLFHEYHGPVYVAGNLELPESTFNKTKSSIFYDTLTLGVYNSGTASATPSYSAGKITTDLGVDYTFEERGDPYLSKQDNYPNFRGLIGGLRLDASEDKGFHNLFEPDSASAANVLDLEACIKENQIMTKPSYTAGSRLVYRDINLSGPDTNIRLGLTKENRFKPTILPPKNIGPPAMGPMIYFVPNLVMPPNTKEIGEIKVTIDTANTFHYSTGLDAKLELKINYNKFGLTTANMDSAISVLNGTITGTNFETVFDITNTLRGNLTEYQTYITKVQDFKNACVAEATDICVDFVTPATCVAPATCTDHSAKKTAMQVAAADLRTKVTDIKTLISAPAAEVTFEMLGVDLSGKEVINQKDIKITFSNEWKNILPLIKSHLPSDMKIEFIPYDFSNENLKIVFMHNLYTPTDPMRILNQVTGGSPHIASTPNWQESYDLTATPPTDAPTPLLELDCPDGMSLADWNIDMSSNTNFAWNYANTPAGAVIEEGDHGNLLDAPFAPAISPTVNPIEGHEKSYTKSVVDKCFIPKNRNNVFGFYVCKELEIEKNRTAPLNMIGTFIVEEIKNDNTTQPVHWHNIWDAKAAALIISDFNKGNPNCNGLTGKTWGEVVSDSAMQANIKSCSAMNLVTNGPNNFTWTTIDPDIGLQVGQIMTSKKVLRTQRWVIREDSRSDSIK